jgi:hypothetical protein
MVKRFELLVDWAMPPTKRGKPRPPKKDVKWTREFETEKILLAEYIDDQGKVVKKYSIIIDEKGETYKCNMPFNKLVKYVQAGATRSNRVLGYIAHSENFEENADDTQDV